MKCPYCYQEIDDESTVCPICGKPIEQAAAPESVSETASESEASSQEETVEAAAEEQSAAPEAASSSESTDAPESTDTPEGAIPAEPAKKSNKKKVGIIAAVIALIAVVAAGAALFPRKSGKDIVIDAFKSITASGQTDPSEEIFGWKEMNEKLAKSSSAVNLELQLQDSSEPSIAQLATGKFGMTVLNDVENKKMSFVMGLGYADMNIANLEFFLDDRQMMAAVPELSGKAFTLNYAEDLEGQIAASPFLGQMFEESGISVEGLNGYLTKLNEMASSGDQLFDFKALWKRYKEGSKAIDDLKAAMTVEDAEKKNFTVDGADQSCKGYNVTITKDALIQFLTTSKEFFLQDETLKSDFVEYMDLVTQLQGAMNSLYGVSAQTPQEMQEQVWKDAEEQFDTMLTQLKDSMGDVAMVVYVRKDGKMASFDYSTTAKISGEDIRITGTVTFAGGYNMMANVKATMDMRDSKEQGILITVDKTGAYESGKSLAGGLNASVDIDGDQYGVVMNGDYAVEGGTYNLTADFQKDGVSALMITSSGLVQDLVKGESFEVFIDSLKGELGEAIGEEGFVELSGFYKAGPLDQTVELPEGESFDILAATEDDWNTVLSEIMGNFFGLMMSFQ